MTGARLPAELVEHLRLPVIAAPMFRVSGPDLVVAACRAGVIGAFPAPNARTIEDFERYCATVVAGRAATPDAAAWAVNLIVHSTYARLAEELEIVAAHRPPLVIAALGSPARALETVHAYGGVVFADVNTPEYAEKAVTAGADGLVLLSAGAGGHTGHYSPFALLAEVRAWWDGPIVIAGAVSTGRSVAAARALGADLAYVGTRFIAARESLASEAYREMLVAARLSDIVLSDRITGVAANWLRDTLPTGDDAPAAAGVDFTAPIERAAWRDVWSAGQGVAAVQCVTGAAEIVDELATEYRSTLRELATA